MYEQTYMNAFFELSDKQNSFFKLNFNQFILSIRSTIYKKIISPSKEINESNRDSKNSSSFNSMIVKSATKPFYYHKV